MVSTKVGTTKAGTPVAGQDHPALELRIGTYDEKTNLSKVSPTVLPNDKLVEELQMNHPKDKRWKEFRNDFRYIYVMNWMSQCRGYLKLASEHFDVDLFEIELFNLVSPPPIDDLSLLLHKTRIALISKVHGKKTESLALFEPLYRVYFGIETPLGGVEESDEELSQTTDLPLFDDLYIDEKIDILYSLMVEVTTYSGFREFVEKNKLTPDVIRASLVYRGKDPKAPSTLEDYLLVFDGTAMYKRIVVAPSLVIPKKRSLSPQDPETAFGEDAFDAQKIRFELIYKDVYRLEELIEELKIQRNHKKNRLLLDIIKKPAAIAKVFEYEIRKRRILMSHKKENEMARLLATRKKSSRIEAKQKQRLEEEQERKLRELEELKYASSRHSRRSLNNLGHQVKSDVSTGLSRADRLKLRKGTNEIQELTDEMINTLLRLNRSSVLPEVNSESLVDAASESVDVSEAVPVSESFANVTNGSSSNGVSTDTVASETQEISEKPQPIDNVINDENTPVTVSQTTNEAMEKEQKPSTGNLDTLENENHTISNDIDEAKAPHVSQANELDSH